jgi:hypothetical protein
LLTLCKLNIVKENYIHISVLLAVFQTDLETLLPLLKDLIDQGYICFDGEVVSMTNTGDITDMEIGDSAN